MSASSRSRSGFLRAVLFLLLSSFFMLVSLYIVTHVDIVDSDFFSFWLAGKMVLQGHSPYDEQVWLAGHQMAAADWISDPAFLYPLPLAICMAPLSLLDLPIAYAIWVWVSQWILFFTALRLLALFEGQARYFAFPVFTGLLLFRPLFPLLRNGQLASLVLLCIWVSAELFIRRRPFWAGWILAFAALKPNLGVPVLGLFALYLLFSRRFRGLLGIGAGLLTILLVGWLLQPDWMRAYFDVLTYKQVNTYGYAPSIWGLFFLLTGMNVKGSIWLSVLFCLLIVSAFVFLVYTGRIGGYYEALSLVISLAVFMTPYLWTYDQILLLIPVVTIMALIHKRGAPFLVSALFFLLVDVVFLAILWSSLQIEMENLGALIPLLLFGVLFSLLNRRGLSPATVP